MSAKSLALLLDGPLQSWGTSSRYNNRDSDPHPSKSGVIGMIAAAMGIDKYEAGEAEKLRPLTALGFSVYGISRVIGEDKPPTLRLRDYHTIGGGYDDKTHWGRLSISNKAEGGAFGTVTTEREYLMDAVFAVVFQGDPEVLNQIAGALSNPVWGIWLGRKCCVPAVPVSAVIADDSTTALTELLATASRSYPTLDRNKDEEESASSIVYRNPTLLCRDLEDGEPAGPMDGADTYSDTPISYGQRQNRTRTVRRF